MLFFIRNSSFSSWTSFKKLFSYSWFSLKSSKFKLNLINATLKNAFSLKNDMFLQNEHNFKTEFVFTIAQVNKWQLSLARNQVSFCIKLSSWIQVQLASNSTILAPPELCLKKTAKRFQGNPPPFVVVIASAASLLLLDHPRFRNIQGRT